MTWGVRYLGSVTVAIDVARVVGKGRPRFRRNGRAYTPKATREAERAVREAFLDASGGPRADHEGPVAVSIVSRRELAKSNPKSWAGRCDLMVPDLDNVEKLVMDALNGVAYRDDSQVVHIEAGKARRTPHGTGCGLEITVSYYRENFIEEDK